MLTIVETPRFVRMADMYWNDADRLEFIDFIAASPDAGAVVPGSGGLRKIRWGHSGRGKRNLALAGLRQDRPGKHPLSLPAPD
ncbi:MAG: hypothetical protein ABIT83_20270 [Massilia sp.]